MQSLIGEWRVVSVKTRQQQGQRIRVSEEKVKFVEFGMKK